MAKIKIYKPSGLQYTGKKIKSIDKPDESDIKERSQAKSKLSKSQGITHVKARDVVIKNDDEKGFEM